MEANKKASNFSKAGNASNLHLLTDCDYSKQELVQPTQELQTAVVTNQQQSTTDSQNNGNCFANNNNVNCNNCSSKEDCHSWLKNSVKRLEKLRQDNSGGDEVVHYQNFSTSLDLNPSTSNKSIKNIYIEQSLHKNQQGSSTRFALKSEESSDRNANIWQKIGGNENNQCDKNDKDDANADAGAAAGNNVKQNVGNYSTQPSTSALEQHQSAAGTTGLVSPFKNNECENNNIDAVTDKTRLTVDTISPARASSNNEQRQQNQREIQHRRYTGDHQGRDRSNDRQSFELNSVYSPGCKKQSLNHLLNFHYMPKSGDDYLERAGSSTTSNGSLRNVVRGTSTNNDYNHSTYKFSKEQFIQANFQFVINWSMQNKIIDSVDTLVDWSLIEQINVHTNEEMQCPICLYPPKAAKMTRCGHVYCWLCVLQYLSLSNYDWCKCPICFEIIHAEDLKSVIIIKQQTFEVGTEISLQLMCCKKGTNIVEKLSQITKIKDKSSTSSQSSALSSLSSSFIYPWLSSCEESKRFSKYLIAKRRDVFDILNREEQEILDNNRNSSCTEFFFVEQALDLLNTRRNSIMYATSVNHEDEKVSNIIGEEKLIPENNEIGINECNDIDNFTEEDFSEKLEPIEIFVNESIENLNKYIETNLKIDVYKENDDGNGNDDVDDSALKFMAENQMDPKFYYFYQSIDGQNIFLHPLNVKMLQACYGNLSDGPRIVRGRILQIEQYSMNDEHRQRYAYLSHLPLTCPFSIVEIHLIRPYVTDQVIKMFKKKIIRRRQYRQKRVRMENERDRRIDAINDRKLTLSMQTHGQMHSNELARNVTSFNELERIDLQSNQHFPICGSSNTTRVVNTGINSFRGQVLHDLPGNDTLGSALHGNLMAAKIKRAEERHTVKQTMFSNAANTTMINTVNNSNGNYSYSAMALQCQQVMTPWTVINNAVTCKRDDSDEDGNGGGEKDNHAPEKNNKANLGDVIALALSKKTAKAFEKSQIGNNNNAISFNVNTNHKAVSNQNNRKKKNKKGVSIYLSGGIQFNSNN